MQVYWTYRKVGYTAPVNIDGNISLNGWYTPSSKISNQFSDYEAAGLTKIIDNALQEEQYTGEIVPGVKKLTRFIIGEYNEAYVNGAEFASSVQAVGAEFQIEMFLTPAEAIVWIKANTSLVELSPWVFELAPEAVGIMGEVVPQRLLTIE